jgi:hypothetical protein
MEISLPTLEILNISVSVDRLEISVDITIPSLCVRVTVYVPGAVVLVAIEAW